MFKPRALSKYHFSPNDRLLLDTNVWLMLFGQQTPFDSSVTIYSEAFKQMLLSQCKIFTDAHILSDFILSCSRFYWQQSNWNHAGKYGTFKEYSNSYEFTIYLKVITENVVRIVDICTNVENAADIAPDSNFSPDYREGTPQYTDQILCEMCRVKGFILVTDEINHINTDIQILTANPLLL